ncbi:MAG TPA: S8 family serine peptidase, partial [Candidatus Polarisedimenticolia bacterium]|nr:S8 family serine peptidase [Candidatus Polarisedimenticolia bacterium]
MRPVVMVRPQGRSAMGDAWGPERQEIISRLSVRQRGVYEPGELIVALTGGGAAGAAPATGGLTGVADVDARLRQAGASAARPLLDGLPQASGARAGASRVGVDLSRAYVVRLEGTDPGAAARRLRGTPGIAYAGPNWTVSSLATGPRPLPAWVAERSHRTVARAAASSVTLPTNYGLTSSLQSHLNAGGVNALGAFDLLGRRYAQLPGEGVIVTNVSLGDLTDQSMADKGDQYVRFFGPTTIVVRGQRYLDVPSLPLIPTFVASPNGRLDPRGTVEFVDPQLSEVLLDFSVMAPLPHDRQRPGAVGDGPTDLLGIAPGAAYRLVVAQEPTIANIIAALLAAANQSPRPDVITASLGFGIDADGFPGRYLEDDPVARAAVRSIVHDLGIVVCISSNDGTRLIVPTAIGPDGGSAPTDRAAAGETSTSIDDVAFSTAPSRIDDSGAIDVGGSTLDDIFSAPPQGGGPLAGTGSFPATRLNGSTFFSSGFGSRLDVAAPSDNIPALEHDCTGFPCTAQMVSPVLEAGTSASAPMVAAAAAVAIQSGRLAGRPLAPLAVRDLLARTGRDLPDAPLSPRPITVGRQLDVTSAVESILGADPGPSIVRVAVAHRQSIEPFGAIFVEATDPGAIDLQGPNDFLGNPTGQNITGPITIAPDITGLGSPPDLSFALTIGRQTLTGTGRVFRLLPDRILAAAGQPVASSVARTVPVTYEVRSGSKSLAAASFSLTLGPSDGTYTEALTPVAPAVVPARQSIRVQFDLSKVRQVSKPRLVVSSIDHFSPLSTPLWRIERAIPIVQGQTSVNVPAEAFSGGAGIYGLGILQDSENNFLGRFIAVRVLGAAGETHPPAPTLAAGGGAPVHTIGITRGAPQFTVAWDASGVTGAAGAALEISAPGPTLYGSINTFTNHNGDRRDANGTDSGSMIWYPLPGVSGSATIDATTIDLPSSLYYSARVFATDGQKPLGLASPVSSLSFDDGLTPGLESINDFDIVPDGGSVVATAGFDQSGNLLDSALRPYDPATGLYGPPFASDRRGQSIYYMFGSDTALHRTATIRYDWFGSRQDVESYDSLSGRRLASVPVDSATQYFIVGGRVDSGRHRAALLGWSATDFSDGVLPFDLAAGALGPAIFSDNGIVDRGIFTTLDVDATTGKALLARMLWGDLCLFWDTFFTSVDLDRSLAAPVATAANCVTGMAADQRGGVADLTVGPIFAFPSLFPVARLQTVDQITLNVSQLKELGARSPLFPVVDPVNRLLLIGLAALDTYTVDNNAMSAVGVYDAQSGRQLALLPRFNFISQIFGNNSLVGNERGIQIDPATRTGWTYGP